MPDNTDPAPDLISLGKKILLGLILLVIAGGAVGIWTGVLT